MILVSVRLYPSHRACLNSSKATSSTILRTRTAVQWIDPLTITLPLQSSSNCVHRKLEAAFVSQPAVMTSPLGCLHNRLYWRVRGRLTGSTAVQPSARHSTERHIS